MSPYPKEGICFQMIYLPYICRKSPESGKKKGKMGTKWDQGGTTKDMAALDFSSDKGATGDAVVNGVETSEAEVSTSDNGCYNIKESKIQL